MAHVTCNQFNSISQVLIDDHVAQGDNCVWVLVQCNDSYISLCFFSSRKCSSDQRTTASSKVEHNNFPILERHVHSTFRARFTHLNILGLFTGWLYGLIFDNAGTFSLDELSVALDVLVSFLASQFIELILDRIMLESLVSCGLKVISEGLEG